MHIHQPGGHHQPGGVDGPVSLTGQTVFQKPDPAVLQQHILKLDVSRYRVDHPAVLNQKSHRFLRDISGARRFFLRPRLKRRQSEHNTLICSDLKL